MAFKPYLHVERFGNTEVEGIELGEVHVFPKIDGTNSSIWFDERVRAGSRTRELDTVNPGNQDNQGFAASLYMLGEPLQIWTRFFDKYPNIRLYGEWLVPHTFKGYRENAWRKFWIFDVYNDDLDMYYSYNQYAAWLQEFNLDYIPPLATIKNGTYENFLKFVENNFFLCPDGGSPGEGICIKNYDYQNKYGKQAFAKIIRQEFKDEHYKLMGAPNINSGLMNEERILDAVQLSHLIDKTQAKITSEKDGWSSKNIPELFGRVFHDVVTEELWNSLKKINFGTVNFKTLKALIINRVKQQRPELF